MPVLVAVAGLAAVLTFGSAAASTLPVDSGQSVRIVLEENASAGGGIDLSLHVLWTIAGAIIGSVIMAYLYLLKRGVGGFPENPEWVAPISIEPSSSFPEEAEQDDHHEPGGHS
ncbi:MAG: hypothetical protein ACE5EF_05215 [Dehalococcoidia bacterium]